MAALNRPNPVVGLFAPQVLDAGTVYIVCLRPGLYLATGMGWFF
jgi:hypothetical protein